MYVRSYLCKFLKKTVAHESWASVVSILEEDVRTSLKTLWFSGLRSTHTRTSPFGLSTTTIATHQGTFF